MSGHSLQRSSIDPGAPGSSLEKKALPDSLVDEGGGWSPEVRDCPHRWAGDRGCGCF